MGNTLTNTALSYHYFKQLRQERQDAPLKTTPSTHISPKSAPKKERGKTTHPERPHRPAAYCARWQFDSETKTLSLIFLNDTKSSGKLRDCLSHMTVSYEKDTPHLTLSPFYMRKNLIILPVLEKKDFSDNPRESAEQIARIRALIATTENIQLTPDKRQYVYKVPAEVQLSSAKCIGESEDTIQGGFLLEESVFKNIQTILTNILGREATLEPASLFLRCVESDSISAHIEDALEEIKGASSSLSST